MSVGTILHRLHESEKAEGFFSSQNRPCYDNFDKLSFVWFPACDVIWNMFGESLFIIIFKVRVFTYAVGPPAHSTEALRSIACDNRGKVRKT